MLKEVNSSKTKLIELTKSQTQNIIGGCPEDATIFHKLGCAIAEFMNEADGNRNRGPRNGYYF